MMQCMLIDDKIADRLWESSKVVDELVKAPDSDIPKELLQESRMRCCYSRLEEGRNRLWRRARARRGVVQERRW